MRLSIFRLIWVSGLALCLAPQAVDAQPAAPGLAAPGLAAPGLAAPGLAAPGLKVEGFFSDSDRGVPAAEGRRFRAGERVYYEGVISGFGTGKGEEKQILLDWEIRCEDDKGILLSEAMSGRFESEVAKEDKDWRPRVRYEWNMPAGIVAKQGRCILKLNDKLGGAMGEFPAPFAIDSNLTEAPAELEIRDFKFSRATNPDRGIGEGESFRAGEEILIGFNLTGYKLGEKNRYKLFYGIAVVDSDGKAVFAEPKAAQETDETFYPKRYLPCSLNFAVQKVRAGIYRFTLTATDELSGKTVEGTYPFRIE